MFTREIDRIERVCSDLGLCEVEGQTVRDIIHKLRFLDLAAVQCTQGQAPMEERGFFPRGATPKPGRKTP